MTIIRVPAKITHNYAGGEAMNVWHCRTADDDPATWQLDGALDALQTFYTAVGSLYPTGTTIRIGEGMVGDPLGAPFYVDDDPRTIAPAPSSALVDATFLAIVVGWRTTSATRSGRGRTFLGPLSGTHSQGNGTPLDTTLTTVRNAATALITASTGQAGWSWGVLSTTTGIFRDVTGSSVKDRFAYLSSRRD